MRGGGGRTGAGWRGSHLGLRGWVVETHSATGRRGEMRLMFKAYDRRAFLRERARPRGTGAADKLSICRFPFAPHIRVISRIAIVHVYRGVYSGPVPVGRAVPHRTGVASLLVRGAAAGGSVFPGSTSIASALLLLCVGIPMGCCRGSVSLSEN